MTVPTYTTNTTRDHQHILANSGRQRGDRFDPEAGAGAASGGAVLPPNASTSSSIDDVITGQSPDTAHVPSTGLTMVAGRLRRRRRSSAHGRRSAATTLPASSTPAAPAARRAASCSITGSILQQCRRLHRRHRRPISAGTTRCSCPSFRPATPTSIAAASISRSALGGQIYYAESLEKLAANIEEVRPTIMVVVPRLFEMLRATIIEAGRKGRRPCRNI